MHKQGKDIVGIYKITNPKGLIYIGQSVNIKKRWAVYNRMRCKGQPHLYNSFKKYGVGNHIFEIIEECSPNNLLKREQYWIENYNSIKEGMNCRIEGKGGYDSEETRKKKSIARLGHKPSKETGEKIAKSKMGHECYTDEWRENIRQANTGRIITKKWRENMSKSMRGRVSPFKGHTHNDLTKEKMSKAKKGNILSWKEKIVIQYDLDNNFIKEYKSVTEAYKYHKGDIAACCRGKQKTSAGYIWKYKKDIVNS